MCIQRILIITNAAVCRFALLDDVGATAIQEVRRRFENSVRHLDFIAARHPLEHNRSVWILTHLHGIVLRAVENGMSIHLDCDGSIYIRCNSDFAILRELIEQIIALIKQFIGSIMRILKHITIVTDHLVES